FATNYTQGYLECSAAYTSKFLSTIDYFFTGLDCTKHLMSDDFPLESIIKMSTKQEQPFVLGFENGDEQLVSIDKQTNEARIDATAGIKSAATLKWHIHVTIKAGMNKITCYAPRINSSTWAHSKYNLNVIREPRDQLLLYIMIGGAISGVIIIALGLLIDFLARRKTVVVVKTLTPEEVKEFLLGSGTSIPGQNKSLILENMEFDHKLKIPSRDLTTENTVIGSGQYGIVHQGKYG
ncbi:unnamed protein product, partial [Allacma fusca]